MFENLKKKLKGIFSKASGEVEPAPAMAEPHAPLQLPPVPDEIKPQSEAERQILEEAKLELEKEGLRPEAEEELQGAAIAEEPPVVEEVPKPEEKIKGEKPLPEMPIEKAEEKEIEEKVTKLLEAEKPPVTAEAPAKEEIEAIISQVKEAQPEIPLAEKEELIDEKTEAPVPAKEEFVEEKIIEKPEEIIEEALKGEAKKEGPKGIFSILKKKPKKEEAKPPEHKPKEVIQELEEKIVEQEERPGFFKLLSKITHKELTEKDIKPILWELEVALLENDVAKEVAEKITAEVKQGLLSKKARRGTVEEIIKSSLKNAVNLILSAEAPDILKLIAEKKEKPFVIIFFGFNGTGKTLTIGKFAKMLSDYDYTSVMAAGDTFRAAAIEQLEVHAKNLNTDLIKQKKGADSAAVIFDAIKHAKATGIDVVLADTAGRSHTNANLMDELKKIVRVNKPDLKIFVGDSLTGNDAAEQAKLFNEAVGIDGSVLTKVDTDPKGGACLSAAYITGKPILYLGTGQNYEDIMPFSAKWFVEKVF